MNNEIKDFLAKTIFKILSFLNQLIKKKDKTILLYSNVGLRDNVRAIYDYLIENKYNEKYEIFISADSLLPEVKPKNVKVISCARGIFRYLTAGHVFYCQGKIPIFPSLGQNVVQMWHGTPFKSNNSRGNRNKTSKSYYTYILSSSPYFEQIIIDNFFVKKNNVAICGQPRTDVMYEKNEIPSELAGFTKLIFWMPTYRMSSALGDEDVIQTSIVPVFSEEDLDGLEKELEKFNILLLIKLHPMQNLDLYKKVNYEHLKIVSHQDFQNKGWHLYKLLSRADALISDYSSVFYDFMLMDRPIGFAIDDIEEYRTNRGFVVDDPDFFMAGEKIKTKDQFYLFLKNVAEGLDPYKEQRNEVNKIVHSYLDNKNCERALNIGGVNK